MTTLPAAFTAAPPGTMTTLLRRAHGSRRLAEAVPVLQAASRFLPSFHSADDLPVPPRRVLVSDGDATPALVFVPSFLAGSGPHQFARLAAAFEQRPRAAALVLPGFDRDASVPATWEAALDALALAVRTTDAPYVLVGHSIGGVVAHALAQRLEDSGSAAAGVVLIDTLDPDPDLRGVMLDWALGSVLDRDGEGMAVNDANLLAMGAYLRILEDRSPVEGRTPTLQVRAELPHGRAEVWPAWDVADSVVSLPADHFSVLEEQAAMTAKLIASWLPGVGADAR